MTRLVAAELFKLRTTRTFAAMVGATFALLLLLVVLSLALTDTFNTKNDVRSLLSSASLSGLFMLVLGVVAGAGEYRHGTIASTLLVTPDRLRAVTAQTLPERIRYHDAARIMEPAAENGLDPNGLCRQTTPPAGTDGGCMIDSSGCAGH